MSEKLLQAGSIQQMMEAVIKDRRPFSCTLKADGWIEQEDGKFVQTVACKDMKKEYDLSAPMVPSTGDKDTDEILSTELSVLCAPGNSGETLDGQISWTCYKETPNVDLTIHMLKLS